MTAMYPLEEFDFLNSPVGFHCYAPQHRHHVGLHYHPSLEILYLQGVEGWAYMDSQRFALSKKCLLYVPSNSVHWMDYQNGTGSNLVCHIDLFKLGQYLNWGTLLEHSGKQLFQSPFLQEVNNQRTEHFSSLLEKLYRTFQMPENDLLGQIPLISELFPLISGPLTTDIIMDKSISPLIRKIITYTEQHLDEALSVDGLAKKFSYSSKHVAREFKRCTHMTYNTYLTSLRLRQAKKLLGQGYSLKQITPMLGLKNPSYLIKIFRDKLGITPKEYQKSLQG